MNVRHWLNDDYVKFLLTVNILWGKSEVEFLAYINPSRIFSQPTSEVCVRPFTKTYDKIILLISTGIVRKKGNCTRWRVLTKMFSILCKALSHHFFVKTGKKNLATLEKYSIVICMEDVNLKYKLPNWTKHAKNCWILKK